MSTGIYVSPTEFVSFAQRGQPLAGGLASQMATRSAAGDLSGLFGLLPNPDPVLKSMGKDIAVYRNLLADPLVMGARRRRAAAVMSMERGFDQEASSATPKRVIKALERMLSGWDLQRIVRQLMDGAFFGYRVSELMWGSRDGLVRPLDVVAKPSEWFGFDPDDGRLKFKPLGSIKGQDVPDRKFLVVGKMRSWENPYGEPDLAACFWPVTFKRGGLKFWVTFTEKYGTPWAVGKLPRNTQPGETNELAAKLAQMVRDAVAVIPDDASVELLTMSTTSNAEMFEKLLMYCRSEISIALLGNNQSTEASANRASAVAAQEVERSLRDDDAEMIKAGINQLIHWVCEVNWPGVPVPVYDFWEQEEVDEVLAKRDQLLKGAGVTFTNNYFKRAYKLEDGDLVEPADAQPKPAPGAANSSGQSGAQPDDDMSFADEDFVPPDQAALDAAIEQLPADEIQAAMRQMLAPAIDAIMQASTPEQVSQALAEAYPELDSSALEQLMEQAYFVADLVGRDSARAESKAA
jgi:phage gp29-like protein